VKDRVVSKAKLEALGDGRFRVSGILDAATAGDVLEQSQDRFGGNARVEIDLAGVSESDSAGLALLLEWLRMARQHEQKIHFVNLPEQVIALARISEVDDLLLANGTNGASRHDPAAVAQG
jgi:phospholipid transport system transporter-binding protein